MREEFLYSNILNTIEKDDFISFISILESNRDNLPEVWDLKKYNKNLLQSALEHKRDFFVKELINCGFIYPEKIAVLLKGQSSEIIDFIKKDINIKHEKLKHKVLDFYVFHNADIQESVNFLNKEADSLYLSNIIKDKRLLQTNREIQECIANLDLKEKIKNKTLSLGFAKQQILKSIEENNFANFITYLPFINTIETFEGKELLYHTLSQKRDSFTKELVLSKYPYPKNLVEELAHQSTILLNFLSDYIFEHDNVNINYFLLAIIIKSIKNPETTEFNFILEKHPHKINYAYLFSQLSFNRLDFSIQKKIYDRALKHPEGIFASFIINDVINKEKSISLKDCNLTKLSNKEAVTFIKRAIISNNEKMYCELLNKKSLIDCEKEEIALICVSKNKKNLLCQIKDYQCVSGRLINTMYQNKFLDKDLLNYTQINKQNLIALMYYSYEISSPYLSQYKNFIDEDIIETIAYNKEAKVAIDFFNHFDIKKINCAEKIAMSCVNRKNLELLKYICQFNSYLHNMPQLIEYSVASKSFEITNFLLDNINERQRDNNEFKKLCEKSVWVMLKRNMKEIVVNDKEHNMLLQRLLNLIDCKSFHKTILEEIRPQDMAMIAAMAEKQEIGLSIRVSHLKESKIYKL